MSVRVGDRVSVVTGTIQRSNGAAWRGDVGVVIGQTGDGYRVQFDGFVADNVKADEITKV